ncbi:hypothetical protein KP77_14810 [Jeotgalibacillus alimentarius]|uniref:Uncharacterized protein n=1 Tax=Jeotgalibacillus alimentarius TaxID=135826 RepID=A0A0C2W0G5_9BACL|nr:hypothetical protein KP77_14810 [Jeotgalibacillus alimentarius]
MFLQLKNFLNVPKNKPKNKLSLISEKYIDIVKVVVYSNDVQIMDKKSYRKELCVMIIIKRKSISAKLNITQRTFF